MPSIPITLHTRDPHPPLTILGTVPEPDCPLAVTLAHIFDHPTQRWEPHSLGGFMITHRPTGFSLGNHRFSTAAEALAVVDRLDWRFPAWAAASGAVGDPAMLACRSLWRNWLTIHDRGV